MKSDVARLRHDKAAGGTATSNKDFNDDETRPVPEIGYMGVAGMSGMNASDPLNDPDLGGMKDPDMFGDNPADMLENNEPEPDNDNDGQDEEQEDN